MTQTAPDEWQDRQDRQDRQAGAGEQPQLPDAAQEVAGEVAKRVQRERLPGPLARRRGRVLLFGYIGALVLVGLLAAAAHMYSVLPGDLAATQELQESSNPILYALMYGVSYLGYPLLSAIILVVTILLLLARLWIAAVFLVATLIADGIGELLKLIVGRHRPLPDLVHVTQQINSPSFPSGHTLHYTVFYGFLAFVLATEFRPSWPRNVLIAVCVLLIVLVGPSRVYLGEHWTSDVLGGYLIGFLCLVPLIAGYLWAKRRFAPRDQRAA
jgi:undecaprenyl-diphosphatase